MANLRMVAGLFLAVWLAWPSMAAATTTADKPELDRLYAELKAARSVSAGLDVEARIVKIWLKSGDEKIDEKMGWAITAIGLRSFELALSYLDSIVLNAPDYAEGWNKRATVYFYIGEYDKSLADIDRTLALEPRHFGALAGLGLIKERQGKLEEALDAFRRALALHPNLEDIQVEKFLIEDELGQKL